jgi:CO/xanthine dehydrogenase Mo-binding subunit
VFGRIGFIETLEAAKNSPHYKSRSGKPGHGRGVAAGFWFNVGAESSSAAAHVGEDGTVTLISGNPDIGGSRASLALMAAEELGIPTSRSVRSSPTPPRSASTSSPAAAA